MPASLLLRRAFFIFAFALVAGAGGAHAQFVPDALARAGSLAPDLVLPDQPSVLDMSTEPALALFKPAGAGPFPALVLLHQCSGLRRASGSWQNLSMLDWAREAVTRGYVVLLLDSLGPRGVDSVCMGAKGNVNFPRGLRDAFLAADHLRRLPYVDPQRVVFAGFSWGAMVGLMGSSAAWGRALVATERFRAVVAFYPGCFDIGPRGGTSYAVVNRDIDRPLLVLGGGLDTETPPAECTSRLEPIKAAGSPVEWHVYPEATHCWDCANLDGLRKTDWRGSAVEYRYSRDVTRDSATRMFDFFDRAFARPR